MSTYVVNSGRGLQLYYFLKEPIPLYKHYQKTLREFKEAMIERLWNDYTSSKKEKDIIGVLQGFRTIAFFLNQRKIIWLLLLKQVLDIYLKNLEYYKKNFPEWYQEIIIEGKPKGNGRWTIKRDLYNWWKDKIKK